MKTALLLLGVLLAPQEPQDAASPPATAPVSLRTNDGDELHGSVLGVAGDKVRMRISVLGGSMTVTRAMADFDAPSKFRIEMALKPPKSFEEHFAMAKRAAELKLRMQAGAEARAAIAAAAGTPEAEQRKSEVRGWGASALEQMIQGAVQAGDLDEARHCLKLLTTRLADQRTEEQLEAIAAAVEGLEQKKQADRDAARLAKADARARAEIERKLKPIAKNIEQGNKTYEEGVRKSRNTTTSANLCERAIGQYKKAYESLRELLEKYADDAELQKVAASLGGEIHDNGIRAALHAANMLCVRSDYKGALDWTQRILKFDPACAEAQAMAQTIQQAAAEASDVWGWGWRVVDDRPRPRGGQ